MKYLKTALSLAVALLAGLVILLLVPFILIYRLINRWAVAKPGYTDIFAPYYSQLNPYGTQEEWLASQANVPDAARHLYALHQAQEAILGRGFALFFDGKLGRLAPEAADGFAAIGMDDAAALIRSAMARLGDPYPLDEIARQAIVNLDDDTLLAFDETPKFRALVGNPKKFGGAPKYYSFADAYAEQHRQTAA